MYINVLDIHKSHYYIVRYGAAWAAARSNSPAGIQERKGRESTTLLRTNGRAVVTRSVAAGM